jgi:hypothetical protein
MKPIKVIVKIEQNWAMYSTREHGNIVELDYPVEGRNEVRVYPLKDNEAEHTLTNHITLSSLPQGIIGAEVACKSYLYGKGYFVAGFIYPEELKSLRNEAFKTNKK